MRVPKSESFQNDMQIFQSPKNTNKDITPKEKGNNKNAVAVRSTCHASRNTFGSPS